MNSNNTDEARLDKWLWAARVYKTRQLAAGAISGGHVEVNGNRVKPSRLARVGDELKVRKGPYTYTLFVEGISSRRGPASVAATLYAETEASVVERQRLAGELRTRAAQVLYDPGKPDPRSQRDARARKRGQN